MKITEIKYFRPDGKSHAPDGIYVAKGSLYREIIKNNNSFIRNNKLTESFLFEKIAPNQYRLDKYQGGMIVFATSVNAVIDKQETNKIKAFLQKTYYSLMNYAFKDKKLNALVIQWNKEFGQDDNYLIGNFTVGNFFKGKYIGNNNEIYNDRSTSIEINDIPSEMLLLFAIEICKEFKQETVLVKDFNTNKIFLVDDEGIEGDSPQNRIDNANKELQKLK